MACSTIYEPRGKALEYAPLATNPYRGCGHGCKYCYVPAVLRMDRKEFDAGAKPRPNFLKSLQADAEKHEKAGVKEQVLLSFTTDPYHPGDNSLTRRTLQYLRLYGLGFCTLTKGGARGLRDLDLFRPNRDSFASTMTTLDPAFSRVWEPEAALPEDRMAALRAFHDAGIFTWISLEPVIDTAAIIEIIKATHGFVDFYKLGRANYLPQTKSTDWRAYTLAVTAFCNGRSIRHYVKQDLQAYLPPGYHNPLRTPQHH